jgi:ATP-dependent protease ClpP protease subunit
MHRLPSNLRQLRAAWRTADEIAPRESPCFRVTNAEDETPKLFVYDVIGGWDNDSGEFVKALQDIDSKSIELHLNSPGGFVYDGVAMFEALDAHPAKVHVKIDGLAASAASFLAMVGDSIEIARAGRMMIHDAQAIALGGPAQMREAADLLDSISDDIAGFYAARAGGTAKTWRAAMQAETWYSASESVDAKLADRVMGAKKQKDTGSNLAARMVRARAAVALGGVKQ